MSKTALAEFYSESPDKFSLSLIADRFICGGSALTTGRGVSRKRLALVEAVPGYPDVEALLLSKEINHYRKAKSAFISANNINPKVLLQAHKNFYSSKFKMGQFRSTQNWIGESIESAVYLPPPPEKLASLLQDWCELSNARVHTIEHAIECYVRLLAIHPFPDANGRVARALLDVMTHRIAEGYLPLVMYKLGVSPEISRAGYKSFGVLTNEKAQHPYW